jgi:nucleoside-diphosphate-sugar epimerase
VRILVVGGTGAIGRLLVPGLVRRGHDVTATTRSPERAGALAGLGAEPAVRDALDSAAVEEAVRSAAPEVVVCQVTSLSGDFPRLGEMVAENARVRRASTLNALAAAVNAGVRRFVAQGIAFAYAIGAGPAGEEEPFSETPTAGAALETDRAVLRAEIEGVVARYGYLYGPGTWYARDGAAAAAVRAGELPTRGSGEQSLVHVGDAAAATVLLCERGEPGAYNVVDDEPAPQAEWQPAFAAALGAPAPKAGPGGPESRGASNAKLRALGWEPRFRSWREGFREGIA